MIGCDVVNDSDLGRRLNDAEGGRGGGGIGVRLVRKPSPRD